MTGLADVARWNRPVLPVEPPVSGSPVGRYLELKLGVTRRSAAGLALSKIKNDQENGKNTHPLVRF